MGLLSPQQTTRSNTPTSLGQSLGSQGFKLWPNNTLNVKQGPLQRHLLMPQKQIPSPMRMTMPQQTMPLAPTIQQQHPPFDVMVMKGMMGGAVARGFVEIVPWQKSSVRTVAKLLFYLSYP